MNQLCRLGVIVFLFILWSPFGFSTSYERDGQYLYRTQIYTELWSRSENVVVTAKIAHRVMVSIIDSLIKNRILPDKVMSREDLEKFRRYQENMDDLVFYLNDFIQEQRARGGKFEMVDSIPDALLLFGGHKFSINYGKGVGASAVIGLVIAPVWVTKIDMRTNKVVDQYASVRTAIVGWPTVDVGLGIGGGARMRVGLGAIWDLNKAFVKPDQFWGVGPAVSWSPVTAGVGLNVKAGVLSNWEMPGWIDFAFGAVSLEAGPTAELGTPRFNVTTIMKGEALMGIFEKSQQDLYRDQLKLIAREVDRLMREGSGTSPLLPPKRPEEPGKDPNKEPDRDRKDPDPNEPKPDDPIRLPGSPNEKER